MMIKKNVGQKGLSLVELLVIIAVIMILAGLLFSAGKKARNSSYSSYCLNNLRQISLALLTYYNDHKEYPVGLPYCTLSEQLKQYIPDKKVFICPADTDGNEDSYSEFYVYRGGNQARVSEYLIGCPRHQDETSAINIFSLGRTQKSQVAEVLVDEVPIKPGDSIKDKSMVLEDGSEITASGVELYLVQSFRMPNGRLYSIVKVPDGETGSVTANITPGSAFEIVTPSSIAAVRGTKFIVTISYDNDISITKIDVTAGSVEVCSIDGGENNNNDYTKTGNVRSIIKPGESIEVFGKRKSINHKKIEHKITFLNNKIKKETKQGHKMKGEKKRLRRLTKLIDNIFND
ncbi:FecR domain-containing protein [bacterium]|nr:FecR domain-containing protein [bacterium]